MVTQDLGPGRLPTFLIIGAMKGGTTMLHALLDAHPDIFMSREKELHFFTESGNWHRGLDWYRRHFRTNLSIRGEASPTYAAWPKHDGVAERVHEMLPDARLLYCVRDPVARALSHYAHALATGYEMPPVNEGILREPFLRQGRYATQLRRYLDAGFSIDRIHLVQSEQLRSDRDATARTAMRFVGADPSRAPMFEGGDWHSSARKRVPTALGRTVLRAGDPLLDRLPWRVRGPARRIMVRPFSTLMPKLELTKTTQDRLHEAFAEEADDLRRLTDQPLKGWTV